MNNRSILLIVLAVGVLGFVGLFILFTSKPTPTNTVPSDAIANATKYLEAREDAIGADQASPVSWLTQIQPITTASWFATLQPNPNSQTSSVSQDYLTAHQNGYIVKAQISGCAWRNQSQAAGAIYCQVFDQTTRISDGTVVASSEIPFGWGHNGNQPDAGLNFVKQNNQWLINGQVTSQGE